MQSTQTGFCSAFLHVAVQFLHSPEHLLEQLPLQVPEHPTHPLLHFPEHPVHPSQDVPHPEHNVPAELEVLVP